MARHDVDDALRRQTQDSRWVLLLLACASLLVLVHAARLLGGLSPLGDDASSHITTIATLASRIAAGDGWWSTDYNLGFPMVLYYQPLPHIASALVCLALGGPERATLTYELLVTLVVALQPWAVYAGMRRVGLPRLHAAAAGALGPLILNSLLFGYTTFASLKVGLYTQAWGNVALPLAIGELVAVIRGRPRWTAAVAACAFAASTHMFYAIVLVPPIGLMAVLLPLLSSPSGTPPRDHLRAIVGAVGRLVAIGIATFAVLSAWMVPLAMTQSYFGGWPFSTNQPALGWGWAVTLKHLAELTLLDGANVFSTVVWPTIRREELEAGSRAVPVLTLAAYGGVWALLRGRPGRPEAAALLVLCGWSLLGLVGTAGLGSVFELYPLHGTVQLFRYGAFAQFAFACAAGVGLAELGLRAAMAMRHRWRGLDAAPVATALLMIAALLVAPVVRGSAQLRTGFRVLEDDRAFAGFRSEYLELVGWLRALPRDGRMLVGPRTETRKHFHGGLLSHRAQRPAGQSYGVGLHDSLHFYTLEFFDLQRSNAADLADLYDFRLVVSKPGHAMRGIDPIRTPIHENANYVVSELDVSGQIAVLMRDAGRIEGTPRGVRHEIRAWLNGNGPATRQTFVLDVTDPRDREHLTEAPVTVDDVTTFADAQPPRGAVLESAAVADRARARVRTDEPLLVVFKHGYHPFWRATVNGEPAPVEFAFPGFAAVRVEAGEHEVSMVYRWPRSSRWMLAVGLVALVVAAAWDVRSRGRRAGAVPDRR